MFTIKVETKEELEKVSVTVQAWGKGTVLLKEGHEILPWPFPVSLLWKKKPNFQEKIQF